MDNRIDRAKVRVIKADRNQREEDRLLIREHPLTVFVNEKPAFHMICTRDHLKELVMGRLYTEGLIKGREEVCSISLAQEEEEARVVLTSDSHTTQTSRKSHAVSDAPIWKPDWIFMLADRFQEDSLVHLKTQGSHSCFLARRDRILFTCEDIGRHNIIDKAVGYAVTEDIPLDECILYVSGRIPADMTRKVIAASIPVLVTKAVPTAESVKLAGEYGLTLICRAYPDQFEIYSLTKITAE